MCFPSGEVLLIPLDSEKRIYPDSLQKRFFQILPVHEEKQFVPPLCSIRRKQSSLQLQPVRKEGAVSVKRYISRKRIARSFFNSGRRISPVCLNSRNTNSKNLLQSIEHTSEPVAFCGTSSCPTLYKDYDEDCENEPQ